MLTVTPAPHTGIIYSDIGTSPLYVLNGIWPASGPVPSKEDVIGGVSAIVWSLTLLPLCKYVSHPPFVLCRSILTLCQSRSLSACTLAPLKVAHMHLWASQILTCFRFFRRGWTFRTVSRDLPPEVFRNHSYSRLDDGWKKEARRHQATQVPSVAILDMGTFFFMG